MARRRSVTLRVFINDESNTHRPWFQGEHSGIESVGVKVVQVVLSSSIIASSASTVPHSSWAKPRSLLASGNIPTDVLIRVASKLSRGELGPQVTQNSCKMSEFLQNTKLSVSAAIQWTHFCIFYLFKSQTSNCINLSLKCVHLCNPKLILLIVFDTIIPNLSSALQPLVELLTPKCWNRWWLCE